MPSGHLIPGGHYKKNKPCPCCEDGVSSHARISYFSYESNRCVEVDVPVLCDFCQGDGVISKKMLTSLKKGGWI